MRDPSASSDEMIGLVAVGPVANCEVSKMAPPLTDLGRNWLVEREPQAKDPDAVPQSS